MNEQTENLTNDIEQPPVSKRKGGRPSKLKQLQENREQYDKMLQYLRLGATITSVCGVLGIAPNTFAQWMHKGKEAVKGMYHEFYWDVIESIGHASVMVEAQIKVNNPMAWLKNGPRRLLGDEWRDDPSSVSIMRMEGEVEHEHIVYDGRAPATDETLAAALTELKNAGLLDFKQNIIDGSVIGSTGTEGEVSPEDITLPEKG